jgi:hypothetical protein
VITSHGGNAAATVSTVDEINGNKTYLILHA